VDADVLGIIDTSPGNTSSFTPVNSAGIGMGYGASGWVHFTDIDGLAFDPTSGILYGTQRSSGYDLLLQINPTTGTVIQGAFAANRDYVVIGHNTREATFSDIDDITIDASGIMYGIANGQGRDDRLVTINKDTGEISNPQPVTLDSSSLNDIEGLSFFRKNIFYATTGTKTSTWNGQARNSLFRIELDPVTADKVINLEQSFNGYSTYDFEAVSCRQCLQQ
jgi:hypothetical protein